MKLLHTADLHLGLRQYGFPAREHDFYTMLDQIVAIAVAQHVDGVLLAGDVFDATKPPPEAVLAVRRAVAKLHGAGIRTLGIDGNHDTASPSWLKVCDVESIGTLSCATNVAGIDIFGIDSTYKAEFQRRIETAVQAGVRAGVLMIHQPVSEMADFSSDFSLKDVVAAAKAIGAAYVAMGDIHTYKETVVDGVRIVYPGSPETTSHDDPTRDSKSVTIVEFERADSAPRTQSVLVQPRKILEITLATDADEATLLATLSVPAATRPLVIINCPVEHKSRLQSVETALKGTGTLYRAYMTRADTNELKDRLAKQGFERRGAVVQLKQSIELYFEPDTDEYGLILRMLDTPDRVAGLVDEYLQSKGVG